MEVTAVSSNLRQITLNLSTETKELLDSLSENVHLTIGELIDRAVLNMSCEEPEMIFEIILCETMIYFVSDYLNERQIQLVYCSLVRIFFDALKSPKTEQYGIISYFANIQNKILDTVELIEKTKKTGGS